MDVITKLHVLEDLRTFSVDVVEIGEKDILLLLMSASFIQLTKNLMKLNKC